MQKVASPPPSLLDALPPNGRGGGPLSFEYPTITSHCFSPLGELCAPFFSYAKTSQIPACETLSLSAGPSSELRSSPILLPPGNRSVGLLPLEAPFDSIPTNNLFICYAFFHLPFPKPYSTKEHLATFCELGLLGLFLFFC